MHFATSASDKAFVILTKVSMFSFDPNQLRGIFGYILQPFWNLKTSSAEISEFDFWIERSWIQILAVSAVLHHCGKSFFIHHPYIAK